MKNSINRISSIIFACITATMMSACSGGYVDGDGVYTSWNFMMGCIVVFGIVLYFISGEWKNKDKD